MIVKKDTKSYVERYDKPDTNWTNNFEKYWLVDSNTELAEKIRNNAPFFDPVVEDDNLVDIIPTERPEPEPEEPTQDEINLDFDFRITCLELGL